VQFQAIIICEVLIHLFIWGIRACDNNTQP
jgi:hypothetical protein